MNNLIIGIAGGSGSGKTTLAYRLKERFGEDEVRLSCNRWLTNFKPQLVVVNWKICYDNSIEDVRRNPLIRRPAAEKRTL